MKSKIIERIRSVLLISGSNLVVPFISFVLSVLVIRLCSGKVWGEIVNVTLWMGLALQVASWGNKEFLLREFSRTPGEISGLCRQSLMNRLWLLIPIILIILFFPISSSIKILLAIWFLSRFLSQSFDVIIVYERTYRFVFTSEIAGLSVILIPVLILRSQISLPWLIFLFTLSACVKCVAGLFYFRKYFFSLKNISFDKKYLVGTFSFLMLGLSGMFYGKTDQYCVALMLSKTELASYAVFIGFLGFSQYTSTFLLSPFTKNIFRMKQDSLKKLQRLIIFSGSIFSMLMIGATFLVMTLVYKFHFSWKMYLLGIAYIYPFFIFQLRMIKLVKENRQRRIITITLAASVINFVLNFLLTPSWKLEGALFSGVVAEWVMVAIYFSEELLGRKKSA